MKKSPPRGEHVAGVRRFDDRCVDRPIHRTQERSREDRGFPPKLRQIRREAEHARAPPTVGLKVSYDENPFCH